MKSRASESKQQKEIVVSDDDKPPTRSALTQSLKISVRNITAHRGAVYPPRYRSPLRPHQDPFTTPARKPSRPRLSTRALPDGVRCGVDRLALAVAQPDQESRAARKSARTVERRAARADRWRLDAAARHHAVLHEPARSDEPEQRAAPHRRAGDRRIPARTARGRRPARRGRPQPRAGSGAPLSRSRAVSRARFLLHVLPLLHALARRRPRRTRAVRRAPRSDVRLHPARRRRFATC